MGTDVVRAAAAEPAPAQGAEPAPAGRAAEPAPPQARSRLGGPLPPHPAVPTEPPSHPAETRCPRTAQPLAHCPTVPVPPRRSRAVPSGAGVSEGGACGARGYSGLPVETVSSTVSSSGSKGSRLSNVYSMTVPLPQVFSFMGTTSYFQPAFFRQSFTESM